jgi:hypothetical protein
MSSQLQDYATLPLPLTSVEKDALADYEATIAHGLMTFYEVGAALIAIKTQKLYRANYRTFEEYCAEKWHIGHSSAYRMIEAAEIRDNLSPIGDKLPENESQARALNGLEPDQQRQVWAKAVDTAPGGKVTAQHIKEVRQQEIPMPAPEPQPVAAPVHQVSVFVPDEQPRPISTPKDRAVCLVCGQRAVYVDRDYFMTCEACGEKTSPAKYRKLQIEGIERCYTCKHYRGTLGCPKGYAYGFLKCQWYFNRFDSPDDNEPEAVIKDELEFEPQEVTSHASGIIGFCDFCEQSFLVEQCYSMYEKGIIKARICRACASKALAEFGDEQPFGWHTADREKICNAGLRIFRVVIGDLTRPAELRELLPSKNGIIQRTWQNSEYFDTKAALKRRIKELEQDNHIIFENRI